MGPLARASPAKNCFQVAAGFQASDVVRILRQWPLAGT